MSLETCPCGSGKIYAACCQPIIEETKLAPTAETLMRARYTAHVVNNSNFIIKTTHPSTYDSSHYEAIIDWVESTTWKELQVLETQKGQEQDQEGFVLFRAFYEQYGKPQVHDEHSYFKKEKGVWYFVKGRTPVIKSQPLKSQKVARNAPCPCGSGKKYKKCCG